MKLIYGCDKDSTVGEKWEIGEYKFKRCPLKVVTNEGVEFLEAYKFYKNQILPMSGGWLDQSEKFIQAVRVIDAELNKISKLREKENARQ